MVSSSERGLFIEGNIGFSVYSTNLKERRVCWKFGGGEGEHQWKLEEEAGEGVGGGAKWPTDVDGSQCFIGITIIRNVGLVRAVLSTVLRVPSKILGVDCFVPSSLPWSEFMYFMHSIHCFILAKHQPRKRIYFSRIWPHRFCNPLTYFTSPKLSEWSDVHGLKQKWP